MNTIKRDITERLSRYTDFTDSDIETIVQQVLIALDIDTEPYPVITTESDQAMAIELEYDRGVRNGMDTERERISDAIEQLSYDVDIPEDVAEAIGGVIGS